MKKLSVKKKVGVGKYKRTPEIIEKMRKAHLGNTSYWKGKKRPNMTGEKHPLWKGEEVSYSGIHHWIKRELGLASRCMNLDCVYPRLNADGVLMKKPKKFEWANISKEYKREKEDFISLCASCHQLWDLGKKEIKYEKRN